MTGRRGESDDHYRYDVESALSGDGDIDDDDQSFEVRESGGDDIRVYQVASGAADDSTFGETTTEVFSRPPTRKGRDELSSPHSTAGTEAYDDVPDIAEVASGTILEAAFVDPAYSWPPKDGEGRNAIELQASILLLKDGTMDDADSVLTTESMKRRMRFPKQPQKVKQRWWNCCRCDSAVEDEEMKLYEKEKQRALEARQQHEQEKRERLREKEKEHRKKNRYNRVPEGILIYRLDTSTHELSLMSEPHSKTDLSKLVREMKVVKASPSSDRSRRGIELVGEDDRVVTLVACEQRTATAWLEAMNIMFARNDKRGLRGRKVRTNIRVACSK